MTAVDPDTLPYAPPGRGFLAMWAGVIGPPLLWLVHLQVGYLVVPLACREHAPIIVHGVTVAAILLVAAIGLRDFARWRRTGRHWPDSSAAVVSQDRFLTAMGMLLSALIVAALVAQWLPTFFLDPCR
jgi:hypothetical protein